MMNVTDIVDRATVEKYHFERNERSCAMIDLRLYLQRRAEKFIRDFPRAREN
jgi:hypothetical protein